MQFLRVEGGNLLNVELIDKIEINEGRQTATAWNCGVNVHSDSPILFAYVQNIEKEIRGVLREWACPNGCGKCFHTAREARSPHGCPAA